MALYLIMCYSVHHVHRRRRMSFNTQYNIFNKLTKKKKKLKWKKVIVLKYARDAWKKIDEGTATRTWAVSAVYPPSRCRRINRVSQWPESRNRDASSSPHGRCKDPRYHLGIARKKARDSVFVFTSAHSFTCSCCR